MALVENELT